MTMTISNSTNNGYITEDKYVGGLVGFIHSAQSNSILLFIINSDNRGSVSSKSSMACGMICVGPEGDQDVKINIKNSINKGNINAGADAYGITIIITKARNGEHG